LLLTQNMTTAVNDARLLKVLYTNIRWAFSMRGDPADCEFLAAALPLTGRRLKPRTSPFEEPGICTPREERALLLEDIARLPDRKGYLWPKARNCDAFMVNTAELNMPHGKELEEAIQPILQDADIGRRSYRADYEREITERDARWVERPPHAPSESLTQAYRQKRAPRDRDDGDK